jgi:hypothetical protein
MVDQLARNPHCDIGIHAVIKCLQAVEDYPGKGFSHDAKERDPTIVVAVAAVTLVYVKRDNLCIPHVLKYFFFFPAL